MNLHYLKNLLLATVLLITCIVTAQNKPNIVFILCDDMGYGEVQRLNPQYGIIKTPNLNQMAEEGMIFTDAHSGSAVCTPTRYGLLTGRYSWRTRMQKGVIGGSGKAHKPLIDKNRTTVASLLKRAGYDTAIFGKWHLGFKYEDKNGTELIPSAKIKNSTGLPNGIKIIGSPIEYGFDQYLGFHHAGAMKSVFENDVKIKEMDVEGMLPLIAEKATSYIKEQSTSDKPFFLYVPLNSPHTPIVPSKEWLGKSGINEYADFIMQTDDVIGQILNTLKTTGIDENTLVIFSSDNGPSSKEAKQTFKDTNGKHKDSGPLRGYKSNGWDGGHRVPFIAKWPSKIKANSISNDPICLNSLMKTCAEITGLTLNDNEGEDSFSILPTLLGTANSPSHPVIIHHSGSGRFAIRQGDWKLCVFKEDGQAIHQTDEEAMVYQLYKITSDIGEQEDLSTKHPEIVKELLSVLEQEISKGRTTPGAPQQNDTDVRIYKSNKNSKKSGKKELKAERKEQRQQKKALKKEKKKGKKE